MTKTVLVPLDGSPLADEVLDPVERLLAGEPHQVVLLRVLPPPAGGAEEDEQAAARAHLAGVEARLTGAGVRATSRLEPLGASSDPAAAILAVAAELRPDLIALASHGRSGVLRWIRGSVAELVLRGATAPVLVVTPRSRGHADGERRFRRLLLPLDGTDRASQVLPHALELARRHGSTIVLARVEWSGVSRPLLAAALAPERVAASLHPWEERVRAAGVPVEVVAIQGDPASGILEGARAHGCDLIAMATHGRRGFARWLEGSVCEKVLRHCDLPMLVVHEREEPGTA